MVSAILLLTSHGTLATKQAAAIPARSYVSKPQLNVVFKLNIPICYSALSGYVEGLDKRIVPMRVFAVHTPGGRTIGAVGRGADAVDEVRLPADRVDVQLGPLSCRNRDLAR